LGYPVSGKELLSKVKEIIKEGNATRANQLPVFSAWHYFTPYPGTFKGAAGNGYDPAGASFAFTQHGGGGNGDLPIPHMFRFEFTVRFSARPGI
jgi:hypothetical protein